MDLLPGFLILAALVFFYFLPSYYAGKRHHPSKNSIIVVNVFFGWTLIGWVACLAWALSGKPSEEPTPETHVKCPDCAELVRREAKVCKHCGCKLQPQ